MYVRDLLSDGVLLLKVRCGHGGREKKVMNESKCCWRLLAKVRSAYIAEWLSRRGRVTVFVRSAQGRMYQSSPRGVNFWLDAHP